jgi:hypothetical protein
MTESKDFFLVYWYKTEGRENGCNLVWAKSASDARTKYLGSHYSPIEKIVPQTADRASAEKEAKQFGVRWENFSRFSSITDQEFARARNGEVVEIESGT